MTYVLIHEYSDHSGFKVCGVTEDPNVAKAWFYASRAMDSGETNVYEVAIANVLNADGYNKWGTAPA